MRDLRANLNPAINREISRRFMRLKFKDDTAIFYPLGFLDGDVSKYEISEKNINSIHQKSPRYILISLKNAVYFNKIGFNLILEAVLKLAAFNGASVGFCDYNEVKFKALKRMSKGMTNLSFFETANVAALFWGEFKPEYANRRIIVFNDDADQKRQIALKLSGIGYIPTIAKDLKEFKSLHKNFEYSVYLTQIKSSKKDIKTTLKENVVIYELEGFIDSAFINNFDQKTFNNSLKIGFKFFVFDMSKSSSINIHGVSFLAKLSTVCAEYGAAIVVCGLKLASTSQVLKNDLEDYGILVYKSLGEFYEDDGTIAGGGGSGEERPKNLTKDIINALPSLLATVTDTLASMSGSTVTKISTAIERFSCQEGKFNIGSVAFYGDLEAKFILCLQKNDIKKMCKILLQNSENLSLSQAYADLLSVICDRIESQLARQGITVSFTLPHILEVTQDENNKNRGVLVRLDIDGSDAIFFLSK